MHYFKENAEKLNKKIRLRKSILTKLRRLAKKENISQAYLINKALEEYISFLRNNDLFAYVLIKEFKNEKSRV